MPWIKNTRYPNPPRAKYKGTWGGKTLPKKVKGQVALLVPEEPHKEHFPAPVCVLLTN